MITSLNYISSSDCANQINGVYTIYLQTPMQMNKIKILIPIDFEFQWKWLLFCINPFNMNFR